VAEETEKPTPPKPPKRPRKGSIAALVAEELAAWEAEKLANPKPPTRSLISTLVHPEFDEWGFPVWPKDRRRTTAMDREGKKCRSRLSYSASPHIGR
jgi:hypothetical protein